MITSTPIVLDASVAISIVRDEPSAPGIRRALDEWTVDGRQLLVPSLFWLEVVNPLVRRHSWAGLEVLHAIHQLDAMDLTTVEADRTQVLLTLDLAERHGLTSFDAAYLALAQMSKADLATLDIDLARAAGGRAIELDRRQRLSETPAVYEHDVTWPDYERASAYLAKLRVEAREAAASRR
jgi:predicted nucleic acid-binding protein